MQLSYHSNCGFSAAFAAVCFITYECELYEVTHTFLLRSSIFSNQRPLIVKYAAPETSGADTATCGPINRLADSGPRTRRKNHEAGHQSAGAQHHRHHDGRRGLRAPDQPLQPAHGRPRHPGCIRGSRQPLRGMAEPGLAPGRDRWDHRSGLRTLPCPQEALRRDQQPLAVDQPGPHPDGWAHPRPDRHQLDPLPGVDRLAQPHPPRGAGGGWPAGRDAAQDGVGGEHHRQRPQVVPTNRKEQAVKVFRTGVAAFAVSSVLLLGACGSEPSAPSENYLNADTVAAMSCASVDKTELDKAITFANRATAPQAKAMLHLNSGDTSLDPLKKALNEKLACFGSSTPAGTPADAAAQKACGKLGEPVTVGDCRKKGTEVFNSIPAERRGDENTPSAAAAFHKELLAEDKPVDLTRATQIVNTLVGFKEQADKGTPMDTAANAAQVRGMLDAKQEEVNVGTEGDHRIDWVLNTQEERGAGSFSNRTLKSSAEVGAFLRESTPESLAINGAVTKAIKDAGYGDIEVNRALTGDGYLPIQMINASQVLGTTYFKDGKVLEAGTWRQAGPGDVYWLYFTSDGRLIPGALVRADCGNANAKQIRTVRPGMPSAPPVENPPGEEKCPDGTTLHPETGTCQPPPECKVNCDEQPPCKGDCTEQPPCTTDCSNDTKLPGKIPGNGGDGDGGEILYPGDDGTVRHTANPTSEAPKAGDPPPTQQPAPPKPPANPVPSGTPAPPTAPQTTATGSQPSSAFPEPCVNPPGSNQCDG